MQLTVRDAARLLATNEEAIYRWVEEGSIPVYMVHDQPRFNRAELIAWATQSNVRVSVGALDALESSAVALPGLDVALAAGGIHYGVKGTDRVSVLEHVVEKLRLPSAVDPAFLLEVLLAREALGTTAIGDGIAIPHVRNPLVLNGCEPSITLCFLENQIDFEALDGEPVSTLFTLISTSTRVHLHLLARLSAALHDPAVKSRVRERAAADRILAEVRRVEESFARPTG